MKAIALLALASSLAVTPRARAEDKPARRCEIFIRKIGTALGSHSSASIPVTVKVGWIGNDEFIQHVGFYGKTVVTNLGNGPECNWGPETGEIPWRVVEPLAPGSVSTQWGEYAFQLPVRSGTVISTCGGYLYDWVGAFFVETNKNTYWLNPGLDSSQNYHFDTHGYEVLSRQLGLVTSAYTDRADLSYYNPLSCR